MTDSQENQKEQDVEEATEEMSAGLPEDKLPDKEDLGSSESVEDEETDPSSDNETASESGDEEEAAQETVTERRETNIPTTVEEAGEEDEWYILQVRGGREEKIKEHIKQKLMSEGVIDLVNEISVPKEKISKIKGGERTVHEKKLFPGYIMINMNLTENARYIINNVRGVYQFLGEEAARKLTEEEVEKMFAPAREEEEKPKVDIDFDVGDTVRIKEGPFENMEGNVEELLPEKGLVRLTVTIFGRATSVELEYWQLESL